MDSIKFIYKIGKGPSSSHTMGPEKAAITFKKHYPNASKYRVYLYGSLAATGKGHLTDKVIETVLSKVKTQIIFLYDKELPLHPNGMLFEAINSTNEIIASEEVYSIGGGTLRYSTEDTKNNISIYPTSSMKEIMKNIAVSGETLWEYVEKYEDNGIWTYLEKVLDAMNYSIDHGLKNEGVLPGGIGLSRKASSFYKKASMNTEIYKKSGILSAYALAVAEENASGNLVVTAPTCGSAGCLPAVLRLLAEDTNADKKILLRALATGGLIGNLVKHNASISGAQVGCQGEIGTACSMAAAVATQMFGGSVRQIEYAAEMGMEHNLGLTCDPVKGLVQIPCIERNAHAANKALTCAHYALLSDGSHRISFDSVIKVMKETGNALPRYYRETSLGGLSQSEIEDS